VLIHLPQQAWVGSIGQEGGKPSAHAKLHGGGVIYAPHEHRGLSLAPAVVHAAVVGMEQEGGDALECPKWVDQTAMLTIRVW
jgi:hypothetical protein